MKSVSLQGKTDIIDKFTSRIFRFNKHKPSKMDKVLEHSRGMFAGLEAKEKGVDECRKVIIRETLAGNFDYLRGFNQVIGKDLAKKAYSSIDKM